MASALVLLPFLSVAQQESDTRNAIFWSVTVYNKNVSRQCNLTPQIEPMHDKTGLYCNQHIYCLYKDERVNLCFTRLLDI